MTGLDHYVRVGADALGLARGDGAARGLGLGLGLAAGDRLAADGDAPGQRRKPPDVYQLCAAPLKIRGLHELDDDGARVNAPPGGREPTPRSRLERLVLMSRFAVAAHLAARALGLASAN